MQTISASVGPLASAVTTSISALQLLPAAGLMVLNGSSGTASAANVAASQTPSGAGALTLVKSPFYLAAGGQYIYITCAADETARTFTVSGTDINNAFQSEIIVGSNTSVTSSKKIYRTIVSIVVDDATADAITVGSYNAVTFTQPCKITITPTGDESANTYTIVGIDVNGAAVTEALAGANASASTSVMTYKTVASISVANTPANALISGNAQAGSGRWVRMDSWASPQSVAQVDVSGTVNYTVQTSMDDPNSPTAPVDPTSMTWLSALDTNLVAQTAAKSGIFNLTPIWVRLNLNSGSGTATLKIAQFSNAPY